MLYDMSDMEGELPPPAVVMVREIYGVSFFVGKTIVLLLNFDAKS